MALDKGLSNLIRQTGEDAKKDARQGISRVGKTSSDDIFDILTYIESDWGLNMKLYPAQRFVVKLYYFLELDDTLPEEETKKIKVRDFLTGEVKYTFTEKEYLHFLYNEGRCNIGEQDRERRELLLSIGRRGGKCNRGDSLVLTDKGLFRIEDLGDPAGPEWQSLDIGVAQEGLKTARSSHFYNNGLAKTKAIRTKSGYFLEGTPHHRIKVMSEEGIVQWRQLGQLREGDFVAIHRNTDLWASDYVDVTPYLPTKWSIPSNVLDEDLGHLLGLLVGDGTWVQSSYIELTGLKDQIDLAGPVFEKALGHPGRIFPDKRGKGWRRRFDRTSTGAPFGGASEVRRFLHNLGWTTTCKRDKKRIPWSILRSPKSVVCAFLRGLFETDGAVEGSRKVTFSTASEALATEVQLLLLNLGIVCSLRSKWNKTTCKNYYHLYLKGQRSYRAFSELIGFDSKRKIASLMSCLETSCVGKSDTENIPHQALHLKEVLNSIPKRNPKRGEFGWSRSAVRDKMGNTIKTAKEGLTYTRLAAVLKEAKLHAPPEFLDHFQELLELNYFYDRVIAVEEAESPVYDLTVPDGESFVANGMVNHNTTMSGIFASYEVYRLLNLYNPQAYYGLPNGNRIQIISVATDKDQASILFNEVAGHLAKCDYFRPYQANNTQSQVNFRTPYDIEKFGSIYRENGKFASFNGKASVRLTFRGATGKGLRGAGNIVIILDEFAHFLDSGPASAEEIYKAVTPSAAAFSPKNPDNPMEVLKDEFGEEYSKESRIVCISSPLGKSGKFYALYDQAMKNGKGAENMLAIQAPTWEINPTVPLGDLQQAYYADPKAFSVEFGAEFNDQLSGWIEREEDLMACVDPKLRPVLQARPKMPHNMGIDIGLAGDGSSISITHVEGDKIIHDYHETWYAKKSWYEANPHLTHPISNYAKTLENVERLDFDEIALWIKLLCKKFQIRAGLFDRWNGIPLEQSLHKSGLKQFTCEHFTRDQSSKIFQSAKMMMYDEKLVLYDYPIPERVESSGGGTPHSPHIAELLSLRAKMISKNILLVEAPQKEGSHDDFSDAFVRSVWLSIQQMTSEKHISHGYISGTGTRGAHSASRASLQAFQTMKARRHGLNPRSVPKALQGSLRRAKFSR